MNQLNLFIKYIKKIFFDVILVALRRTDCFVLKEEQRNLTSETVEGTSLSLESIDNIHGSNCLPLGVFGVGDGVSDNILEEHFQNSTGLFVDEARDTLDSTTTS